MGNASIPPPTGGASAFSAQGAEQIIRVRQEDHLLSISDYYGKPF